MKQYCLKVHRRRRRRRRRISLSLSRPERAAAGDLQMMNNP